MKRCPRCGQEYPDGVGFCRDCGVRLKRAGGLVGRLLGWLGLSAGPSRSPRPRGEGPEAAGGEGGAEAERPPRPPSGPFRVHVGRRTRTYHSWEELPPELQERYRSLLREHAGPSAGQGQITVEVDGERRTYGSIEEMPPELRAEVEEMLERGGDDEAR